MDALQCNIHCGGRHPERAFHPASLSGPKGTGPSRVPRPNPFSSKRRASDTVQHLQYRHARARTHSRPGASPEALRTRLRTRTHTHHCRPSPPGLQHRGGAETGLRALLTDGSSPQVSGARCALESPPRQRRKTFQRHPGRQAFISSGSNEARSALKMPKGRDIDYKPWDLKM